MRPAMTPSNESDGLTTADLLEFYKALSDPTRLRLAGLLGQAPAATAELARSLGLPAPSVARHLSLLVSVGVARRLGSGGYALDEEGLRRRARELLDSPRSRELGGAKDERSKVLASFFRGGVLQGWPTGDQRKLIILREIAARFAAGRTYSEREVNEILKPIYADYTTLRRALVDYQFMNRDRGVYWLGEGQLRDNDSSPSGIIV